MGLPSRSFAADAHHCIMVQVRTGPTEYKCVARMSAPDGELPSDDLGHRKACGYVDDRLRRPSPLPPLPEQARKAGKCSPSPTYPQAPQQTRKIDTNGNIRRGSACGPKGSTSKPLDTKGPIQACPWLEQGATVVGLCLRRRSQRAKRHDCSHSFVPPRSG